MRRNEVTPDLGVGVLLAKLLLAVVVGVENVLLESQGFKSGTIEKNVLLKDLLFYCLRFSF